MKGRSSTAAVLIGTIVAVVSDVPSASAATTVAPVRSGFDPKCVIDPVFCVGGKLVSASTGAVSSAFSGWLESLAHDTAEAAVNVMTSTLGWWLRTPSVQIRSSGVLAMQGFMLAVAAVVGVACVVVQGIRMALSRKGKPFVEVVTGTFVAAAVIAAGVGAIDAALRASDVVAGAIIGQFFPSSDVLVQRMTDTMLGPGIEAQGAALLFAFALVVLAVGLFQAVSLFLRQSAIPLLGLMLPVAAAGQLGPAATRAWLPRVVNVVVAIVLYKPLVALLLAAGFAEIDFGSTVLDAVRGMVCLVLSAFALKWMLKVFAPFSERIASGAGHTGALLAATGGLASAMAMRGWTAGTGGAGEAAAWMSSHGPQTNGAIPRQPGPTPEAPPAAASASGAPPATESTPRPRPVADAAARPGAAASKAAVGLAAAAVVVHGLQAAAATAAGEHSEGEHK